MTDEFDFVITDYVQRLETWATVARRVEGDASAALARAELYAAAVLVPVCGAAIQKRGSIGVDPGGFLMQKASFRFEARADVRRATITGWMPKEHSSAIELIATCEKWKVAQKCSAGAKFVLSLDLDVRAASEHEMRIELSSALDPEVSGDKRRLGCVLLSVEFS
jgi:hypothetical protein